VRTKRDEAIEEATRLAAGWDESLAEVRGMAGDALRQPLGKDSAMRLLTAAILLPLMGVVATMADALPGVIRRNPDPGWDEPASDSHA
jgi:hypothetical protein